MKGAVREDLVRQDRSRDGLTWFAKRLAAVNFKVFLWIVLTQKMWTHTRQIMLMMLCVI